MWYIKMWYIENVISQNTDIPKYDLYYFLQKAGEFLASHRKLSATPHFPFDRTRPSFWQRCTVNLGYNDIDIL